MDIFLHDLNNGLCWNRKKQKTNYIFLFVSNWPGDTLVAIVLPILKICKAEVPEAKKHLFSLVFAWHPSMKWKKREIINSWNFVKLTNQLFLISIYVKITWHPSILHSQQSESYNNKSKGALRPPFWLYWMEIFTNSWVWSVLSFKSKFVLKSSEGSWIASRGNRHRTCSYDKGRPDTLTTASFTNCFEATPRI